jgi:hypothetical protein
MWAAQTIRLTGYSAISESKTVLQLQSASMLRLAVFVVFSSPEAGGQTLGGPKKCSRCLRNRWRYELKAVGLLLDLVEFFYVIAVPEILRRLSFFIYLPRAVTSRARLRY